VSVNLAIFNIGPIELLIMAAAAVMLFGGDLPATARKAARTIGRLRAMAAELGREFAAEDSLPKKGDLGIDLKRLADLDDGVTHAPPRLPGRREDEPIPGVEPVVEPANTSGSDEITQPGEPGDELPAWRRSIHSELPQEDDTPTDQTPEDSQDEDPDGRRHDA
jgi:Sec-independent protein translocase protein TatA